MCATPSAVPISRKIARARSILPNRSAADDFEIGNLRQVRQNIVLHAVGKIGVLLVITEIFKRQHGDTFFRRLHRRLRFERNLISSFDPLWSEVKSPGKNERNGKAERDQDDNEPNRPVRDIEKRKSLRGNLNDEPGHDRVRDRHPVDLAPLELAKKIPHFETA